MEHDRCLKIAAKYLPEDIRVQFIKTGTAYSYPDQKLIQVFVPRNVDTLYTFLHEVAHTKFHVTGRRLRYTEELEANRWAEKIMKSEHIRIPSRVMKRQRDYVADCIMKAVLHGAKSINKKALEYSRLPGGF